MNLPVSENVRIINDGVFLCVQTKRVIGDSEKSAQLKNLKYENVGKEVWTSETYHSRLEDAENSMIEKGVTFCDDFKDVLSFYREMRELIVNVNKGV